MNICIYGASSEIIDKIYMDEAFKLGEKLAEKGYGIVFGGGRYGLMGACARGVHEKGGYILGVAPTFFDEQDVFFGECTEFISTETMRERKQIMDDRSDAIIVLPGGVGTYEEFFEMFTLKKLGQSDKPIVMLNTNHFYDIIDELMKHTAREKFMEDECLELYHITDNVDDAVNIIDKALRR